MKTILVLALAVSSLFAQSSANKVATTDGSGNPAWALVGSTLLSSNTGFGNTALQVCHAQYSFATDGGGAPGLITPANNCTIPANSTITNVAVNWTTAATGVTNTTSIGVTGTGGSTVKFLAATAVASLTGIVQGLILPSVASGWTRLTTAGTVTLTTAVAALTGGVCEIYVFFFTSST